MGYKGNSFYIKTYPLFLHNTITHFIEKWTIYVIAEFFRPLVPCLESVEEHSWGGSRIFPKVFCHVLCVLMKEKQNSLLGIDP